MSALKAAIIAISEAPAIITRTELPIPSQARFFSPDGNYYQNRFNHCGLKIIITETVFLMAMIAF